MESVQEMPLGFFTPVVMPGPACSNLFLNLFPKLGDEPQKRERILATRGNDRPSPLGVRVAFQTMTFTLARSLSCAANIVAGKKPSIPAKRLRGNVAWAVLNFITSSL